ncbi:MAG: DUF4079 domain-containing protein [Crocosphaera sp.]|nr:DUF4079 domain-containing protein [Crocosphaera sp.]
MTLNNWAALIHPILAVVFVFPLIGMAVNFAWQTRQRRLQIADDTKSKIPPSVGLEHVKIGRWLTGSVVGLTLVAFAYVIISKTLSEVGLFQAIFILVIFAATIASLVFLYQSRTQKWRAIFATLTGTGLVIMGCQPGIFRRTDEWYISHYYFGMAASLLMIFSLAIVQDIYKDRSGRWRYIHIVLSCFALLLFFGQGITGIRDVFEIGFYTGGK